MAVGGAEGESNEGDAEDEDEDGAQYVSFHENTSFYKCATLFVIIPY